MALEYMNIIRGLGQINWSSELDEAVNAAIQEGWTPQGNMATWGWRGEKFIQTMVRKTKDEVIVVTKQQNQKTGKMEEVSRRVKQI